jgi:uncharacterized protein YegP (UPF0339 family)
MVDVNYPCYWIKRDAQGEWRWVYYGPDGQQMAIASEGCVSRIHCEESVRLMKASALSPVFVTHDAAENEPGDDL